MLLYSIGCSMFFVFFKQKTAYEMRISDWSSDVCSSDLAQGEMPADDHRIHFLDAAIDQSPDHEQRGQHEARQQAGQEKAADRRLGGDAVDDHEIGRASCRERVCQFM